MSSPGSVLITGAGGGMGQALARALAERGRRLVLIDRDDAALEELSREFGEQAFALALDVGDPDGTEDLAERIPAAFRPVDVLVNNAGHDIGGRTAFGTGKIADWSSIIDTNLVGLMRVTHAILPGMLARNAGHIVNMGSMAGIRLALDMAAYSASKAGVHTFTDILRGEVANTPIRVTEILPGLTRTNIILNRMRGDRERERAYFEGRVSLEPEDIARSVVFAVEQPPHVQVAQMFILPTDRW